MNLPPTIHVAGTNGKGSTIAFLRSILEYSGLKVHAYTSPHLVSFNERIRINNVPIEDEEIVGFMIDSESIIEDIQSTFFETTTAMAFDYFKKNNVDYAIINNNPTAVNLINILKPNIYCKGPDYKKNSSDNDSHLVTGLIHR